MKKIVMLGCENSHVNTFLTVMQEHPDQYRDIEVIGVFSEDGAAMQQVADAFDVPVMRSYDEAVGIADGIVVTARHGGKHYPYAKPYIASGIPMFIDKPITVDEQQALDFMRECRRAGVRLTGGSCCKYAKEIAYSCHNNGFSCADSPCGNTCSYCIRCICPTVNQNYAKR